MKEIDATGGWSVGYKFVSFEHSDERVCEFGNKYRRTGWWTTVATEDDYYWWKLSGARKAELVELAKKQMVNQLRSLIGTLEPSLAQQERDG